MLMDGDYETGSTRLAKEILSKGGLFIDIGANFGLFTCFAAHKNEKVKVISIEPNHMVISRLLNNIRQNGLQGRVQVINAALSREFQVVTIDQPAPGNLGTTVTRAGATGLLSTLSCPLEFIFKENKISAADLVKIDIEGNEFEIFQDFPFEQFVIKNIILEFNELSNIGFYELRSFFSDKGFKLYTIAGEELLHDKQLIPENNVWLVNKHVTPV